MSYGKNMFSFLKKLASKESIHFKKRIESFDPAFVLFSIMVRVIHIVI